MRYRANAWMLEEIGLGKRMAPIVARYLIPVTAEDSARNAPAAHAGPLAIKGTEGMVVSFPKCCYPIPGDSVLGYVSSGRWIVIGSTASSCCLSASSVSDAYSWGSRPARNW